MDPVLESALAPVLRDLARTGAPVPLVVAEEWDASPSAASAMLRGVDGSGSGVNVMTHWDAADRVSWVADLVQDRAVEELWSLGRSTNWPPCPVHPDTHPLTSRRLDDVAVWVCPRLVTPTAEIGSLPSP